MTEMRTLSRLCGGLRGFPLVITHIKPPASREQIKRELDESNDLGLRIILAEQAKLLEL
jgi:hypothetical protein